MQDVYSPNPNDLLMNLSEVKEDLKAFLNELPNMYLNTRTNEQCFGAAVKACLMVMKENGGKLSVFSSTLPSVGILPIARRDGPKNAQDKDVNKLLQPQESGYSKLAITAAEYQVCIDLFLATTGLVDLATIGVLSKTTGGQSFYYSNFAPALDSGKLFNDLRWSFMRPQGLEGVLRVRASQGLTVHEYIGHYCKRTATDVDLPALDSVKGIYVQLKLDDKLAEASEAAVQSAYLYTTIKGER